MTRYTRSRADPDAWPENPEEDAEWFEQHSKWMESAGHGTLSMLAGHLWELAANKQTMPYKVFNDRFGNGLNLRSPGHGLPTALGIISEYGYHVLGLSFYLSVVIVPSDDIRPSDGFFSLREASELSTDAQRHLYASEQLRAAFSYCSTHPDPFR